jgi:hypothetical protein
MIPPLKKTYGKFHLWWNGGAAKGSTCVLGPFPLKENLGFLMILQSTFLLWQNI